MNYSVQSMIIYISKEPTFQLKFLIFVIIHLKNIKFFKVLLFIKCI